jgi:preprotein translocase subunit YajC
MLTAEVQNLNAILFGAMYFAMVATTPRQQQQLTTMLNSNWVGYTMQ